MNIESVNYSLRNLKHRRGRSFLTIFSILIGITTIFIFISFGLGLYNYINNVISSSSADKLIIQAKGSLGGLVETFKLTDEDIATVKRAGGVYDATGVYTKTASIQFRDEIKYSYLIGYDPTKPIVMESFDMTIDKGRELRSGDKSQVVLGYNYQIPNKIFTKPVELNNKVIIQGKEFKVVGFFSSVGNPSDDAQIYITNEVAKEIYPNSSYTMIIAKADLSSIKTVADRVETSLRNERHLEKGKEDFYVQTFEDMIASFSGALNIVIGFIILIALISVLVSAINTANTMITSVLERYREIGVMKAVGARNSEILKIFLFESSFLGFIAGCLGVLLGFIITFIAKNILISFGWGFLQPGYNWYLLVGCIAFATITGAISGVAPAIKASKINAVDALRYE